MPDIKASKPVTVAATGEVVYDHWFLTQLIAKVSPEKAFTIVHLNRSAVVDGKHVLMDGKDAEVSFTLDVWKEMTATPELAAAMEAVTTAVLAYATKKNLL